MAESTAFRREYIPTSPSAKKRPVNDDGSSDETIPSKSPRYVRKKRIPINQARKYHSQLSAQGKICSKQKPASDKCDEATIQNEPVNTDCNSNKSHFSSSIVEDKTKLCIKDTNKKTVNRTLVYSNSFPVLNAESINKIVKSRSCDIFSALATGDTMAEEKLAGKNNESVLSVSNNEQMDENSVDFYSNNSVSHENLYIDSKSRRSSTSTVRERHNSQDSAFSVISIIDDKEIEEAVKFSESIDVLNTSSKWKPHHSRSRSDTSQIYRHESEDTNIFSLPNSLTKKEPVRKKSIFEGQQMIVPTECFFPRPQQGQSLTSFLSSNEFNISAELDRENAHFCISDALISAIEHMKCSRRKIPIIEQEQDDDDESDEEIRKLSQRIRIRRRERQREKVLNIALLSDGRTDTATSQSASPPVSSHSSDYEVDSLCSEDEVEDLELSTHTDSNLYSMKESGLSLSMASLYSDADIQKAILQRESENKKSFESDSLDLSAESVALSLIKRFSEKHLPKASDLQWLVSEQEAPQQLLPLPDSIPIAPDAIEEEYNMGNTRLRGNFEWAPPRPQIIFFIHPYMTRKEIIEKQRYRCAGCGMKIEKNYIKRFRYCEYFGKYFCQCCHSNHLAYIPGRILWKWDFSKYHVSKFAWGLLDKMSLDPLFNIEDVNINLYQKNRMLDLCRHYRMQLFYLKDFVRTCRKAEQLQLLLEQQNHHVIFEPHVYSITDLVQVKSGDFSKHLNQLVNHCLDHVKNCILCQAKGFICEICQKDSDIIFPFQFDKVILCQNCGSCFHKRCCKNIRCPRCIRIQARKKRLEECKSDEEL